MDSRIKETADYYSLLAKQYYLDHLDKRAVWFYEYDIMTRLIESFVKDVPRSDNVLDIGCGTGVYAHFLKKLGFKNIVGIDTSLGMLNQAKQRVPVICGSGFDMPLKKNAFGLIFCTAVLEHVPNPEAFITNMCTFLKPGGYLFLMTPNPNSWALLPYSGNQQHEDQYEKFIYPNEFMSLLQHDLTLVKYSSGYILPGPPFIYIVSYFLDGIVAPLIGNDFLRCVLSCISLIDLKLSKKRGYLQVALARINGKYTNKQSTA